MILFDATPLQSEHRLRGVGAYLQQLIGAIERGEGEKPHYLVSTVGEEHIKSLPRTRLIRTPRGHRPAQVYWFYSELAFRPPLWRCRPEVFLATDFNGLVFNPYGKTVAVHYDLTAFKVAGDELKTLSSRLSDLRWRAYAHKLRRADGIITISQSSKDDAVSLLGIPDEKIRVIHLGVDHARFQPSTGVGRFAQSPPYVVNIGARNANKNQARILEAFARVAAENPNLQLFFAGPWRTADREWLEVEAEKLGVRERVKHLGYVSEAEMPSLYGNAVAFVFPSLEEGFGLPVLEALACGGPVVTSSRSSLPEVAGEAALFVDPCSVTDVADAIKRLLADPSLREKLRRCGFARAAQFTWAKTAQETRDYLRSV